MMDGRRHRAFVGFFGLNRSSRWTAPSIRRNILAPLAAAGFDRFVAGHFNQPPVISDVTSGEHGIRLQRNPSVDFGLDLQWTEPQSEKNISGLLEPAMAVPFRDYDDPTGDVRRNILYQMHSLRRLKQMLQMIGPERFDVFILLRPDLEYVDPLDLDAIGQILRDETDFVSPSWHQYGGLNDRFAFGNWRAAEIFLSRWDGVAEFCRSHSYIHPESLLGVSVSSAALRVTMTEQRALRVRATGETRAEGFKFSKITRAQHRARPFLTKLFPA